MRLLTTNNKLDKSSTSFKVLNYGLALAPNTKAHIAAFNACKGATPACIRFCNLWFSGRTVTSTVRNAMIDRTKLLVEAPTYFYEALEKDLAFVLTKADKLRLKPYVRLNVASDLDWLDVIRKFPGIFFYDYTKIRSRLNLALKGKLPSNYWITASYHERMSDATFHKYIQGGLNVAVVFDTRYAPQHDKRLTPLPKKFKGVKVVEGDKHDLRIPKYDGTGNVVGLRFKGSRKELQDAIDMGFVIKA